MRKRQFLTTGIVSIADLRTSPAIPRKEQSHESTDLSHDSAPSPQAVWPLLCSSAMEFRPLYPFCLGLRVPRGVTFHRVSEGLGDLVSAFPTRAVFANGSSNGKKDGGFAR